MKRFTKISLSIIPDSPLHIFIPGVDDNGFFLQHIQLGRAEVFPADDGFIDKFLEILFEQTK